MSPPTTTATVTPLHRHCTGCGRSDRDTSFPTERSIRCSDCGQKAKESKREFNRVYQRCRGAALARLVEAHREEFDEYLDEELDANRNDKAQLVDKKAEAIREELGKVVAGGRG